MPDYKKLIKNKFANRKTPREIHQSPGWIKRIVWLILIGSLLAGGIFTLRLYIINSAIFRIQQISVVDARGEPVEHPENFLRLDLIDNLNLFNLQIQRIAQDIQARHPELASVSVCKQPPNKLLIIVRRREPVAIIVGGERYLVDGQGFVLPFRSGYQELPEIYGVGAKQIKVYRESASLRLQKALGLLKELRRAQICPQYKIAQIDASKHSNIVFCLGNGVQVKMGQGRFKQKALGLSQVLVHLAGSGNLPEYIDMRFDDPVVFP